MTPPATALLPLPHAVPIQAFRPAQKNIPESRIVRERMLREARAYVAAQGLVPPLPALKLRAHAEKLLGYLKLDAVFVDYLGVLLNNELWREQLAGIPFERRLLLLPKCLRLSERCPAPFDEFGLLCKSCGLCSIQDLQTEAEKLGYAVLVAEGSTLVMKIIESGKIEAVVGVSCLSVLERAFPYMESAAIPGAAIPLLQSDCKDTTVDLDWVWEVIHLSSADRSRRLDLDALRREVETWFEPEALDALIGPALTPVETHGRRWLAKAGKRWRPFLTLATARALHKSDDEFKAGEDLRRCAIAVECFHKASLIHDDIEDHDDERYGEPTLHTQIGTAAAINVGDFLIGEGYRLITATSLPPDIKLAMLSACAEGHRSLSIGQGIELDWRNQPGALPHEDILNMFRHKTSPAFLVALQVGAHYGKASTAALRALEYFGNPLGIAYQIRDDIEDARAGSEGSDLVQDRPSLALSLVDRRADEAEQQRLSAWWHGEAEVDEMRALIAKYHVLERMTELKEAYKQQAIEALTDIDNPSLKGLLRRVVAKIFNDLEVQGWCHESETADAAGREPSSATAG